MKFINKLALILTKILEWLHWIGTATFAVIAVCSLVNADWLRGILVGILPEHGRELNTYGFEMTVVAADGVLDMTAILLFSIGAVIILSLLAMVFRNIHLILKKSLKSTPFQPDNIRMLREIGIFCISVPIVGLVMCTAARLILGVDAVETSVNIYGFSMGLIVLCLTQIFAHGAALEKDVEGLV